MLVSRFSAPFVLSFTVLVACGDVAGSSSPRDASADDASVGRTRGERERDSAAESPSPRDASAVAESDADADATAAVDADVAPDADSNPDATADAATPDAATADAATSDAATPTEELPADGLVIHLRADQGVSFENGFTWYDQTQYGFDATQTETGHWPLLIKGFAGNKEVLAFDTDDYLELPAIDGEVQDGLTFIAVAAYPADRSCTPLFEASNGEDIDDIHFGRSINYSQTTNAPGVLYEVASEYTVALEGLPTGKLVMSSVVHTKEGRVTMYQGKAIVGLAEMAFPKLVLRNNVYIGRSLYSSCEAFGGKLAEILIYERPLSGAEIEQVNALLSARWALTN